MKLIDMLVEDGLNGWQWPEGVKCITQDNGSIIYKGVAFGYYEEPYLKKNIWLAENGTGHADVKVKKYDVVADDWATAIITREQYEAALAAKNDGWIEWGGGDCPVPRGTLVDVRYRNGEENHHVGAGLSFCDAGSNPDLNAEDWSKDDASLDIIAYRLHQPQEVEQAEADDESDLNECIGQAPAPIWNGEGLPPVGCECEAKFRHRNSAEWMYFRCVAVDCDVAFGWAGKDAVALEWESYQFRPIRSEAERKRDESLRVIYEILDAGTSTKQDATDIYDAIAAGKIPGVKLED